MKAEELRIGNKVDYYGNIVTINSINDTDVGFSDYIPIDYPLLDEIKPIPLNEEWVVRFGFCDKKTVYQGREDVWRKEKIGVKKHKTDDFYVFKIYRSRVSEVKIRYIHTLQNLYFALTGEELTLKP